MSRINWSELLEHKGDAVLTWLHECEECCRRGIQGIWLFIVRKIPDLCRHLVAWLEKQCFYALRVAVRASRVAGMLIGWLLIVFGPLAMYPGILTGSWMVLSITGSVWHLRLHFRKSRTTSASGKERVYARA
jgi:hypothetical protein